MRKRVLGVVGAMALASTGMVVLASPASAVPVTKCNTTLTEPGNYTLDNNIGPCLTHGIIIKGDGVTLNLRGHFITGNNNVAVGPREQVGILFRNAKNSTVFNGTVQNFDAGVAIEGGNSNTVQRLIVQNNINHANITGTINPCNYGDGITIFASRSNHVVNNLATNNGPFSGISIVGNSDANHVMNNRSVNNATSNQHPNFVTPDNPEGNGPCGPFSATATGVGRIHQDYGIRVEGPGADGNHVAFNQVIDNQLGGISIHGYVCWVGNGGVPPPGAPPVGRPNTNNLIEGNNVRRNGFAGPDETLDGIGILRQGPFGNVTCASNSNSIINNTSSGNARDGIYVPPTGDPAIAANNTVNNNTVNNNGRDGIHVDGPPPSGAFPGSINNTLHNNQGLRNARFDGFDGNPNCDNNDWVANLFGTVNQPCVAANGGTGTVPPPAP